MKRLQVMQRAHKFAISSGSDAALFRENGDMSTLKILHDACRKVSLAYMRELRKPLIGSLTCR